jgi:Fe-S cluster assembly protein SufD
MTVAVIKTKAEQALAELFEANRAQLPGGKAVAAARAKAFGVFAALGLPHRRVEAWKYTDLRVALKDALPLAARDDTNVSTKDLDAALGPLAALDAWRVVFVNGHYRKELSRIDGAKGLEVKSLADVLTASTGSAGEPLLWSSAPADESVIALNAALMTDGAVVRIAERVKLVKPLLVINVCAGRSAQFVATRHIVHAGSGAEATIIEAHVALAGAAAGQANTAVDVTVGAGSTLTHVQVATAPGAVHLASWMIGIGADAHYRAFQFTAGTALTRNQLFVTFQGENAKFDGSGAFLGRGSDHIDTTMVIDHAVPRCKSRELFKGVLDGRARGVFQGKVIVRPDAQKTDGKQMAQALMLSEDAEFDSKPELEIYADDVVCGHGATVAEIDPGLMFYLGSRGIPRQEARTMLIESFVGDAMEKVESEPLREALMTLARGWLQRPGA